MENKSFICYAWKYNFDRSAEISAEGEDYEHFKIRMRHMYPHDRDWHIRFSEWNEIY